MACPRKLHSFVKFGQVRGEKEVKAEAAGVEELWQLMTWSQSVPCERFSQYRVYVNGGLSMHLLISEETQKEKNSATRRS